MKISRINLSVLGTLILAGIVASCEASKARTIPVKAKARETSDRVTEVKNDVEELAGLSFETRDLVERQIEEQKALASEIRAFKHQMVGSEEESLGDGDGELTAHQSPPRAATERLRKLKEQREAAAKDSRLAAGEAQERTTTKLSDSTSDSDGGKKEEETHGEAAPAAAEPGSVGEA